MTIQIPDVPIETSEEDALGRFDFAANLAEIVHGAPSNSSLRIGVYGDWGEGKTSVLRMMRAYLRQRGHRCVWLVPWMAEESTEITDQLVQLIAQELDINLAKLHKAKRLQRIGARTRATREADPRLVVMDAIFGPSLDRILNRRVEERARTLRTEIEKNLAGRKLVVFVDDLDRLRPSIVPKVLLALREGLDQPGYFYVMGLSPSVLEQGLEEVHQGWGEPRRFLEKIVELPRYLPPVTGEHQRAFVRRLIDAAGGLVDVPALEDVAEYLPRNPRRLKLFIRYLVSMRTLLDRFDEHEFDRRTFYLTQMLRTEFPRAVALILENEDALKDLRSGSMRERFRTRRSTASASGNDGARDSIGRRIGQGTHDSERFEVLYAAIRERGFGAWGRYDVQDVLRVPDALPALTWREVVDIANTWIDANAEDRDRVFKENLRNYHISAQAHASRLWTGLIDVRESHLGEVVRADLEEELEGGLATAGDLIALLDMTAMSAVGFRNGTLGRSEWFHLLNHASQWSHFEKLPSHETLRELERDVVAKTFALLSEADRAAVGVHLMDWTYNVGKPMGAPFKTMLESITDRAMGIAMRVALDRFGMTDGLEAAWGTEGSPELRRILFRASSPFYKQREVMNQLEEIAAKARADSAVQKNFLTFFRQLAYGATQGGSFLLNDCREILSKPNVLRIIWTASVAKPLNPRTAGSMRQDREALLEILQPDGVHESDMPIPDWWRTLETIGFFPTAPESSERAGDLRGDEQGDEAGRADGSNGA